ncbi:MAG: glycosyltransferase [Acidimicrobiia bacterium]
MRFLADERLYTDTARCLEFLRELDTEAETPPSGQRDRYHLYWHGPFSRKQALAVKSFLATQNLDHTELWLWLDDEAGYEGHAENPYLRPLRPFLQVRRFDPTLEAADTPLQGRSDLYQGARPSPRSDFFRFVVLYKHGGTYVDMDVMFLRDLRMLRSDARFSGEFCYRWSTHLPYGNSAVLALRKESDTALALLARCAETGSCYPRTVLDFDANRHVDLMVVPCVAFDPLWPHHDGQNEYTSAPFSRFPEFFRRFGWWFRRPRLRSHREFFPGAFTYHWHNCWDAPEHEDSYFGLFDAEFDRVLRERLAVEPASPGGAPR